MIYLKTTCMEYVLSVFAKAPPRHRHRHHRRSSKSRLRPSSGGNSGFQREINAGRRVPTNPPAES